MESVKTDREKLEYLTRIAYDLDENNKFVKVRK